MLGGPAEGRFQTIHLFTTETSLDMKDSTGDKLLWPVRHAFIQILEIGYTMMAADGAVTTNGVYNIDKQIKEGGARAIINSLGVLTFDAALTLYQNKVVPVNAGASTTPSTRNYPLAKAGDVLVLELVTQGVGAGDQSVRPYIKYREMPVGDVQG